MILPTISLLCSLNALEAYGEVARLSALLGIAVVSPVVPLFNLEATAVIFGKEMGWHWASVGMTCALGQSLAYMLIYMGGDKLLGRWQWLSRQVARTRVRFEERLTRGYLSIALVAGSVGVPPAIAVVALAGGFRVRMSTLLPVVFVGRFARFALLAAVGTQLNVWWGSWF